MRDIPLPKRLGGGTRNANAQKGRAHEAKSLKVLGGRAVRGSGSGREKGDVRRVGVFRLENKTTQRRSFSVTRDLIEKVEASVPAGSSEIPFMEIRVDDQSVDPKTALVFPHWAGPTIVEALAAYREENR